MTRTLASELSRAGLARPDGEIWTMYSVMDRRDTIIVLVLARDGDDAIAVCREDGFDWTKTAQARRVHRHVVGVRGVVDTFEVCGPANPNKTVENQHGER